MNRIKISTLLFLVAVLAMACTKKPTTEVVTVKLNDFFELKLNGSVTVAETDLKLTFTGVPEDSRCPKFTNCIQEGQVRASFSATVAGKSQVVEFTRKPSDKGPITVNVDKYKLQLFDVMPYPENGVKINPADYSARLTVRKLG